MSKLVLKLSFFFLTQDGNDISDSHDTAAKPCYDQQAFMRRLDVIREISDYMLELGWNRIKMIMKMQMASGK